MMSLDGRRAGRAAVMFAWAAFFVYLWVSGDQVRYIGPRTRWVVPFGAITLTAASLAHLPFLRGGAGARLKRSDVVALLVTILPIALVVMVPAPELGSLAAARKGGTTGLASAVAFAPPSAGGREVSFIDVHYAGLSAEYAANASIEEGRPLELTGFVTHDGGTLRLTRFYISCCAADAIPYSVTLQANADFPDDTWLRVAGELVRTSDGFALQVTELEEVEPPEDPYLS